MGRMVICLFVALAAIAASGSAGASYVHITSPFNLTAYGNRTVYLGNVGPGQTFYVTISSQTTNSTGFLFNYGWNHLVVTDLPDGWIAQNSSLNNQELSSKISVSPVAPDGNYSFDLTAVNLGNYSKLGSLRFRASVNVTPNVFRLNVTPTTLHASSGEPAVIYVTINNTGVSDSPFIIGMAGLPAWNSTSTVIALHDTVGRFQYPIYEDEPGVYHVTLFINSSASSRISKESNLTFVVGASLGNDYAALGQGSPLFPIVYAPAYAVMYVIDLIARAL